MYMLGLEGRTANVRGQGVTFAGPTISVVGQPLLALAFFLLQSHLNNKIAKSGFNNKVPKISWAIPTLPLKCWNSQRIKH